ncbi:sensor histidine kinase [Herbaspirillum sp. alder98]|uniref:sensor histidine kinase n=1 Tax=Herbaspirillum sp. alder98 TaxID=2913096 RepID=UPI001CD82135|nr:ATP-binding protein [Herbaspirillum sp. alder98]MCA1326766.1 PAS domain-containing protein [Herbaspirillum sp. alder98]
MPTDRDDPTRVDPLQQALQALHRTQELLAQTEQALRASQQLLDQGELFNNTGSMRYLVDQDLMVCSQELCRIYGLGPGQNLIRYDDFSSLMHPDDRQMVLDTVAAAIAIGGTIRVEHRICRRDNGEVRYISGIGKPVWVDGSFSEYVGTATDITAQRRTEYAVRAAEADLARVSRATTVGQLTASIAHEINQPLMSIIANAGASLRWLDRDPPQLAQARAGLQDIVAEGTRAGDMISGLQDLTRNTEPVLQRLNIDGIIRHILTISRSEIERREVALQLSLAGPDAWVSGDPVQLQQVLLNLVVNAIDAMAAMEMTTGQPRVLSIRTAVEDSARLVVAVQDSGMGIAPEAMERVFDAFYTTKDGGMGMGLAICRSIVEAHGGKLSVAAAAGGGAVFCFALPLQ